MIHAHHMMKSLINIISYIALFLASPTYKDYANKYNYLYFILSVNEFMGNIELEYSKSNKNRDKSGQSRFKISCDRDVFAMN